MSVSRFKNGLLTKRSFLSGNAAFNVIVGSPRAFAGGGYSSASVNTIDYWDMVSQGNSTSFGNLTIARTGTTGCASTTRGIFHGGVNYPANAFLASIDYITIATTGNAANFGTSIHSGHSYNSGASNSTRGIFAGGYNRLTNMDYLTIATTGNSINFGDCSSADVKSGATANSTRMVMPKGVNAAGTVKFEYVTIATKGNTTDFGDRYHTTWYLASGANATRGIFADGSGSTSGFKKMQYITFATTGTALNFGDLGIVDLSGRTGASNTTKAAFGGAGGGNNYNEYVTISTLGNAVAGGTLPSYYSFGSGCAAHGGLQ